MKKVFVILCAAVLLLTVLTGCSKKREKKITIGTQMAIIPEGIAIAEGWLAEALGTEVDVVYFDSGRDVIIAMASGSLDFGLVGSVPTSVAIANGVPCQVVYIQDMLGEAEGLIVRGNLGIKDAQGLAGRRIAVTFSTTSHYSFIKYLEFNNINPRDVDIIDMRTAEITAAFLRGDIDGAYTWEPNVTQMKNDGGVMLTSSREGADRGYPTLNLTIVKNEFAQRYPDLVRAYIRTIDRAVLLHRSDPKAAGAALARFTGLTAEESLVNIELNIWFTVSEQKGMRWAGTSTLATSLFNTATFLYEQKDLSEKPSIELFQKAVTNQYLDEWTGK